MFSKSTIHTSFKSVEAHSTFRGFGQLGHNAKATCLGMWHSSAPKSVPNGMLTLRAVVRVAKYLEVVLLDVHPPDVPILLTNFLCWLYWPRLKSSWSFGMMAVVRREVDLGGFSLRPLELVGEPLDGPRMLNAMFIVVNYILAGSRVDSQPYSSTPPGVAAGYSVFLSSALVPTHFPEVNELGLELDSPHPLISCLAVRPLGSEKSHMSCMSNKPPYNRMM